ncbi:MAG TPA: methyl-accepting chemotaxis protein [Methylococcaceae bacterium]|nr:methyl-accepting chemotaxis protein [Methylococcaceae bacterium]
MNALLAPGVALMRRLTYPVKFALLASLFLPFLAYSSYLIVQEGNSQVRFAEKEINGLRYFEPMYDLLRLFQQHRGMSAGLLSGNASFADKLRDKEAEIAKVATQLDRFDGELGEEFGTSREWHVIRNEWETLRSQYRKMTPAESFKEHTALIEKLLRFNESIGTASNLILDPEVEAYHLLDILVNKLPALTEYLGQARASGTAAISKGTLTVDEQIQINSLSGAIKSVKQPLHHALGMVFERNKTLESALRVQQEATVTHVKDFLQLVDRTIKEISGKAEADIDRDAAARAGMEYFNRASAAIDEEFRFGAAIAPQVKQLLETRIRGHRRQNMLLLGSGGIVSLAILYLFGAFYQVVNHSVAGLQNFSSRLAQGDLTATLDDPATDELGAASMSFSQAVGSLRTLMREVVDSVDIVANSAGNLVIIIDNTQDNMLRQHSETDQVASAMEEMSATAQEIARSAIEASSAANQANREAGDGRKVVEQTIGIIHNLANDVENTASVVQRVVDDSASINVVLDVIKGIAEQTNLLALNAAIEAARAGEQGRGFAVVADEVRTLASRTQQSTQEIRESTERLQAGIANAVVAMNEGRNQARHCVAEAEGTRLSLDTITQSVSRISDMNSQIAHAAGEQSKVVESVNANISAVSGIGQQTVFGARDIAASSEQLAKLAGRIKEQIGRFRV